MLLATLEVVKSFNGELTQQQSVHWRAISEWAFWRSAIAVRNLPSYIWNS